MAKRRDEFVVGRPENRRPVFGTELPVRVIFPVANREVVWPMTARQALCDLKDFERTIGSTGPVAFRLVRVTVAEVERQAAREKGARRGKR